MNCYVCNKDESETWFARIKNGEDTVLLCSPGCALLYFEVPKPPDSVERRGEYYRVQAASLAAEKAAKGASGFCGLDAYLTRLHH